MSLHLTSFLANDPLNDSDILGLFGRPRGILEPIPGGGTIFVPCSVLEAIIRSFTNSEQDHRAWDRFVSGSRNDLVLNEEEVESVLSASSSQFNQHMDALRTRCVTLMLNWGLDSGDLQTDNVGVSVGPPWQKSIGRTTLKVHSACTCRCLCWFVEVDDLYNFDPDWIPRGRTVGAEVATILVRLAQVMSNCGWGEFTQKGVSEPHFEGPGCSAQRPRYWP